jgi:hypothetical protein
MDISDSAAVWKNIFSSLEVRGGEVRGRSSDHPGDLRKRMEQFAQGEVPESEIEQLCKDLAQFPDALDVLAGLLRDKEKDIPQ